MSVAGAGRLSFPHVGYVAPGSLEAMALVASETPIKVLVVDDQQLFADSLAMYLKHDHKIEVVGTASSGAEAIDLAVEKLADVVLMDLFMPRMDGIEATRKLLEVKPQTHVIVLSGLGDDEIQTQARAAGADGYLQKGRIHEHIVDAIVAAKEGRLASP